MTPSQHQDAKFSRARDLIYRAAYLLLTSSDERALALSDSCFYFLREDIFELKNDIDKRLDTINEQNCNEDNT